MKYKRSVVIFDIEASCEDRSVNPHYNMETIEIGAVKLTQGKQVDTFQTFIRPEYISDLTPYCVNLTGITFADLEEAPNFDEAIVNFYEFIYGCEIYSCGNFDKKFLTNEINNKGYDHVHELAKNAINSSHTDLKRYYSNVTGNKKQGMIGMAEQLNIELTGANHRALDDAKNLTKIYLEIEKIREEALRKAFSMKVMNGLITSINNNHSNYVVEKYKDEYKIFNKLSKEYHNTTFLEFIDLWGQSLIIDFTERNLTYINKNQLKALRRYSRTQ